MRFPIFWTRAINKTGLVSARGWSDVSFEEAQQNAEMRLKRILDWLSGPSNKDLDRYSYECDRVICEEVVDRMIENGKELAVISRNVYGALVMNAAQMMFVDIDFASPVRSPRGCLWFWAPPKKPETGPDREQELIDQVEKWQESHPHIALRLYRTSAGLRLIVTNQTFEEVDDRAISMMQELDCDRLYVQLCKSQGCFRARLTPKPWRMKLPDPPTNYLFEQEQKQEAFQNWNDKYVATAKSYQVCQFLKTLGETEVAPENVALIAMHDRLCCSESKLPLA